MARKKEQAVMETLADEAEFSTFLTREPGLCVVDVFQSWCGPCKPVQSVFKRIKVELGAGVVRFATIDCEKVGLLEAYVGDCEPVFLLFGGGELIGKIVGCDAPYIEEVVKSKAAIEQDIINGKAQRTKVSAAEEAVVPDAPVSEESAPEAEFGTHEINKVVTCVIIKPDVINDANIVNEITELINLNGLTILLDQTREITENEVDIIFQGSSAENKEFIKSAPVRILGLSKGETGINAVNLVKEMCGHKEPATAKDQSPKSIRALYGNDLIKNAVHCSQSIKEAEAEIKSLFPDFQAPVASISAQLRDGMISESFKSKAILEETIACIRPSAFAQHKQNIIDDITAAGFQILEEREITVSSNEMEKLYSRHAEEDYYQDLNQEMISGPSLVLRLQKENALADSRKLIGPMIDAKENAPESLRAKYQVGDVNPIHAPSNQSQIKLEKDLFFSDSAQKIQPDATETPIAQDVEVENAAESEAPATE